MKEFLTTNWQLIVSIGGGLYWIINAYKTVLEIIHLRAQIKITKRQLGEAQDERKHSLQRLVQVIETQIAALKKNLRVASLVIAALLSMSLYSVGYRQTAMAQMVLLQAQSDSTYRELLATRQQLTIAAVKIDSLQKFLPQEFAEVKRQPADEAAKVPMPRSRSDSTHNVPGKKLEPPIGQQRQVHELDANRKAHLLAVAGKFDDAKRGYLELIHRAPADAGAINNLGNVYLMMGEVDSALHYYDRAFTADRADTALLFNRAVALDLLAAAETDSAEKRLLQNEVDVLLGVIVTSKKSLHVVENLLLDETGIREARPEENPALYAQQSRMKNKLQKAKKGGKKPTPKKPTKKGSRAGGTRNIRPPSNSIYLYWKFK